MVFNCFDVSHRQHACVGFLLHIQFNLLLFLAFANMVESLV